MSLLAASGDAYSQASPHSPDACSLVSDVSPDVIVDACTARLDIKDLGETDAADAYAIRAGARVRQGHPGQAIEDLSQAIRLRRNDAVLIVRRAALYRSIEDRDRAISDLNEAIALEPMKAQYVFDRAELFRKMGDRRRAFIDYGTTLRLDPAFADAAVHRKTLALEIEKAGALMPFLERPGFDCKEAPHAVGKAGCIGRGHKR